MIPYKWSGASYADQPAVEAAVQRSLRDYAETLRAGPAPGLGPGGNTKQYHRMVQAVQPGTAFDLTCKVPRSPGAGVRACVGRTAGSARVSLWPRLLLMQRRTPPAACGSLPAKAVQQAASDEAQSGVLHLGCQSALAQWGHRCCCVKCEQPRAACLQWTACGAPSHTASSALPQTACGKLHSWQTQRAQVLSMELPTQPLDAPPPAHTLHATLYVWDGTDARPYPHRRVPGCAVAGQPRASARLRCGGAATLATQSALCMLSLCGHEASVPVEEPAHIGTDMRAPQLASMLDVLPVVPSCTCAPRAASAVTAAQHGHAARACGLAGGACHEAVCEWPREPAAPAPGFRQELLRLQRLAMLPMPVAAAEGPQQVPDPS